MSATLTNVDAKNTDFSNALFDGASFASGDIKNAIFTNTSLLGTDLSGLSNGDKADFTGARYDAATLLPQGVDMNGMVLVPEPSTGMLLMLGLGMLSVSSNKRPRAERG